MPNVIEPGEYIQENGGFRPPDVRENGPTYPRILSDRPAARAAGTNGGAGAGPDTSLRVLGKVVPTLTLLGLLSSTRFWAKPTAEIAKTPLTMDPLAWVARAIATLNRWWNKADPHVSRQVSIGAVHGAADLAHTIDLLALRLGQAVFNTAYIANDMALVTEIMIRDKIPQTVQRYLRPIRLRLGRIEGLTGKALLQVRALRIQLRKDIQRLQKVEIDPLKKPVRVTLPGRIHRVETDVKTIKKVQTKHTQTLKKLTFILVPALAVAWFIKTLTRAGLKYVYCPNMKDFGNEICAGGAGAGMGIGRFLTRFWRAFGGLPELLLAATFDAFTLQEACGIVHDIEVVGAAVEPAITDLVLSIEGFICGGQSAAPSGIVAADYKLSAGGASAL